MSYGIAAKIVSERIDELLVVAHLPLLLQLVLY